MTAALQQPIRYDEISQPALLALLRAGDALAYRHVLACNNQRLFRAARAYVGNDSEAEDVVQEAYIHALEHLDTFRGDATLSTWLIRIVVNEARRRLRDRKVQIGIDAIDGENHRAGTISDAGGDDPVTSVARMELRQLLEQAIGKLSPHFRAVFLLREIEEYSVEETADLLDIKRETVKTRLHRARRFIRTALEQRVASSLREAFHFQGARCARITERVMQSARVRALLAPVLWSGTLYGDTRSLSATDAP